MYTITTSWSSNGHMTSCEHANLMVSAEFIEEW